MRRILVLLTAFQIFLFSIPTLRATEELIQAGPMVGHVTDSTASVWLRAGDGTSISGEARQGNTGVKASKIDNLGRGFFLIHFEGLKPRKATEATIEVERERKVTDKVTFRTAPKPSLTGKVEIAFGSCCKDSRYPEVKIFEAMAEEKPDAAIFVGDNSYFIIGGEGEDKWKTSGSKGDWTSPELMVARHLQTRTNPFLQKLIHMVPCYAVWDDHDYGPNNADRTYPLKEDSLKIFSQVWANPYYGSNDAKGIFSSFRLGPVEVYLMDNRFNKWVATEERKDVKPEEAQIWGEPQLNWLMAGLKASAAPVKLIVNGTQVISQTKNGEGHFQEATHERQKLLDFLKEHKIGGIVFLNGDRHYTEVNRLKQESGPDIMEFTSSPIEQGDPIGPLNVRHATQLWGMKGSSYGLVTVDIPAKGKATVRMEARDEQNHVPILNAARCVTTVEIRTLNY